MTTTRCNFFDCSFDLQAKEWDLYLCTFYKCRGQIDIPVIEPTLCAFLKQTTWEPGGITAIRSGDDLRKLPTPSIDLLDPDDPFRSDDSW